MRKIGVVVLVIVLAGACAPAAPAASKPEQPASQAASQAETPAALLPSGDIAAACGGGVTGGGGGITIRADDHLISWQRRMAGAPRVERDLGADAAFAADIRRQLGSIRFADIDYHEAGNMTCSLSVGDHVVSWSQGDAHVPRGVVDIQARVLGADGRE